MICVHTHKSFISPVERESSKKHRRSFGVREENDRPRRYVMTRVRAPRRNEIGNDDYESAGAGDEPYAGVGVCLGYYHAVDVRR